MAQANPGTAEGTNRGRDDPGPNEDRSQSTLSVRQRKEIQEMLYGEVKKLDEIGGRCPHPSL